MDTFVYSLPVGMLRQHVFCTRIPFFKEFQGLNPTSQLWQKQGLTYQKRQQMLTHRRKLSRFGLESGKVEFQVELKSKKLGLHGICDAVIFCNELICPIEFKMSSSKPSKGNKLQLVAYALLIEDVFNCEVKYGYILYGDQGNTEQIIIENWREKIQKSINNMRINLSKPILPPSGADEHQCGQCEFLNFCADRF